MSEQNLISPLLDGFTVGKPMSSHDGIRCYPALKENTKEKYIVKMISVPASQVQLEALLLTGAYKDPADATEYFKNVAEDIAKEADFLKTLSKLEGFLSFDGWQTVPMRDGKLGYQVCLLSPYRRSLAGFLKKNPVTHLQAVNLGLDLCTALAICRRAGYLYVDLKPSNVFITKGKGYRIGDLGFVELASLKYASLPGKYRSPYSPPETHNDMVALNETVDTYAVGMILYQIYNEGTLPAVPEAGEPIPSPANADYEIGEIILKAIAPDPADRWKNPIEMGKALVAYMQRNTVNNVPITPPTGMIIGDTPLLKEAAEESGDSTPAEPVPEDLAAGESSETGTPGDETAGPAPVSEDADSGEAPQEEQLPEAEVTVSEKTPPADEPVAEEALHEDSVPEAEPLSRETVKIPVPVKPEPKPVSMDMDKTRVFQPPVVTPEAPRDAEEDEFDFNLDEFISDLDMDMEPEEHPDTIEIKEAPVRNRKEEREEARRERKSAAKWVLGILLALFFAALGYCGLLFYQNYYIIPVENLTVTGSNSELVVTVDSTGDHSLLKVSCTDTYGASIVRELTDGQAVFTDLLPGSLYRVELEVDGFHKLTGKTDEIFTTDTLTNIVGISAIAGSEDGSVMLNFTVDGAEPEEWTVTCTADGEEDVTKTFTGHSVTIKGLTTGKLYTITLSAGEHNQLTGEYSLAHIPSRVILAEDLVIASMNGTDMTVRWKVPDNTVVESWTVRCYNNDGYESVVEVTGTEVVFSEIDITNAYTVEVTAAGMTQPNRTSITANPINVGDLTVDTEDPSRLTVNWTYEGKAPEGGWLLLYSVDGQENHQGVVKCEDASAVIAPAVPDSAYKFTIQAADSTTIFNNIHTFHCPDAELFQGHGLTADKITSQLLKTPDDKDWTFEGVTPDVFKDTFMVGDNLSIVLKANASYFIPEYELNVLYVIRDEQGKVVLDCLSEATEDWKELWYAGNYRIGELDIPKVPSEPGKYSVSIYFNGMAITSANFTIQE